MQNNGVKQKGTLKERVYRYALGIIRFVDTLDKHDWSSMTMGKQLLRSATSVGANVIEAQAGSTRKDFTNFFLRALKFANETKFWLGLLRDSKKAKLNHVESLLQETIELSNILGSSILTLKNKNKL